MGDVFKEQLIKAKPTSKDKMLKAGLIVGIVAVCLFAFVCLGFLFPIIAVIAIFGGIYLLQFTSREYEYCLTNNELDVDVIYNKQRRKRLLTVDIKKINLCASIKDDKYREDLARGQKVIDVSDGLEGKETYGIVYGEEGQTVKLLFTPNSEMLGLIYKQAPHKVHKQF
jgi:hypothetical protein